VPHPQSNAGISTSWLPHPVLHHCLTNLADKRAHGMSVQVKSWPELWCPLADKHTGDADQLTEWPDRQATAQTQDNRVPGCGQGENLPDYETIESCVRVTPKIIIRS